MKVVSFAVLLGMPVGTVFTKYPLGLNELLIKGENEDGTFAVQHFSDTDDEGGAELFDADVEVTGASFAIDTCRPWVDSDVGIHDSYIVYSADDVGEMIKMLRAALLGYTQPEPVPQEEPIGEVDVDVAAWMAMSPEEKATTSKELLRKILRASPPANVQAILKDVPLETTKEILKEMCEDMTGKPFPDMHDTPVSPWPSVNPDLVMDLVKNVGGGGFNEAFTKYAEAFNAPAVTKSSAATINAARMLKGLLPDDHGNNRMIQLWGVATLDKDGRQTVVALFDSSAFSVNQVYLSSTGGARLSTSQVGGALELRGLSVEDAVRQYNKDQESFPFSQGTLNNVVKF